MAALKRAKAINVPALQTFSGWVAFSRVQMSSAWPAKPTTASHGRGHGQGMPGAMASGHGHGQGPWPTAMASGHGQRPQPVVIGFGHGYSGHGQWPWLMAMADGHCRGHWPWPLWPWPLWPWPLTIGHGQRPSGHWLGGGHPSWAFRVKYKIDFIFGSQGGRPPLPSQR